MRVRLPPPAFYAESKTAIQRVYVDARGGGFGVEEFLNDGVREETIDKFPYQD